MPSVSTVFAYEILFQTAARDLFAGVYEEVRRGVVRRASLLIDALTEADDADESFHKVEFLRALVEGSAHSSNS